MCTITPHLKKMHAQFTASPSPAHAQQIVDEFFSYINPAQAQEQLWQLTHGTITNDNLDAQTGRQRHNLLYFFECSSLFIEAVYYLHNQPRTQTGER